MGAASKIQARQGIPAAPVFVSSKKSSSVGVHWLVGNGVVLIGNGGGGVAEV